MARIERILFIASRQSDYLEDLAFTGLSDVLGKENIIPLRARRKHYIPTHHYPKAIACRRNFSDYFSDLLAGKKCCPGRFTTV